MATSGSPPDDAKQSLQRRAHLPRPASSIWAVALFIAWLVLTSIIGSLRLTEPGLESPRQYAITIAVIFIACTAGLVAIGRGRAHPWGYWIAGASLVFLTLLPLKWFLDFLHGGKEWSDSLFYGMVCLFAAVGSFATACAFLCGKLSRFFYRIRRSTGGRH